MPVWLKEWWGVIALVLGAGVFPFLNWCVAQIRRGLVGHDELVEALKGQDRRLREHIEAHLAIHADLDRRWQDHAVHHARVETKLDQLPKEDAIQHLIREIGSMRAEMRERMAGLEGQIGGTDTRIDGLRDLLDRVGHTVERHDQIISEAALAANYGKGGER
jgi:hypothetical protein